MKSKLIPVLFFVLGLISFNAAAQEKQSRTVSGYIKDNFGQAVSNATIMLEDSSNSTQTDYDGYYKLENYPTDKPSFITIRAVGYIKERKPVAAGMRHVILDVQLKEDRQTIQEVSVIGQSENERHIHEIRRSGFDVSIIDLNRHANEAANVTQVLKRATGVTIREDGGLGSNFVFRINGLAAKIFIDGIPMDNFGSSMSLNNIPVNLVDRVEVYKGVVPAFLGSDALGGAVNIITKRRARPFLDFSYTFGSFNTHQSALVGTFTDPKSKISARLNAFYNYSDNDYMMYSQEKYNIQLENTINGKPDSIAKARRFNDRYKSAMGQLEVGVRDKSWADQFYVGLTYSQNNKANQLGASINSVNGGQWVESNYLMPSISYKKSDFLVNRLYTDIYTSYSFDTRHVQDTASYNYDWSGKWTSRFGDSKPNEKSHVKYKLDNYLARVNLNYDFDAERKQSINLNYNYNSNRQKEFDMIKGYDHSGLPSNLGRHILGLSWQNQWFDKRLSNVLALKYYGLAATKDIDERKPTGQGAVSGDITHYKKNWNFYSISVASRYRITTDGGWKLSYERAYNLPNMEQLFGDGQNYMGNWDLKPERSDNVNTGFYYNTFLNENNFLNIDVTGFYRLAADYINTRVVGKDGSDYFQYYNIPGVKLYGFAAEVKYGYKDLLAVTLNGSYDKALDNKKYTDDTNQQVSLSYGYQVPNRPWTYGSMDVSLIQNDWFQKGSRVQLSYLGQYTHWFYLSEAHLGSLASKDHIPSQTIHSAVLSYSWSRNKYNISFEGRNLTDERAYDNFRLQKPGRAFYLKLRLSLM
ncbi:TonB-dependent receptor [Sphingobacterium tabacisoli]|uniref:TonB-dependent receptor domain-containing protein n=1 Tax=Sphingobacterium tabacisoli TaxID=2044855 RepID=A0ABW5L0Y3_9SPHI|nr:TonB-dependent receptor [Sphingobacterium tabacisoli]